MRSQLKRLSWIIDEWTWIFYEVKEIATKDEPFMYENTIKAILANENSSLGLGGSVKERDVFLECITSFYRDNSDFLDGFEVGAEVKS